MSIKLIVNADDLGASEAVNHGIMESHLNGIVTSASLMVTMPSFEHALYCITGTNLDIGLHIDLTWGRPVSSREAIPSLTDHNGHFISKKKLAYKLLRGKINDIDLEKEISSQINKFMDTGLDLYHIDFHQHFHAFPPVMKALTRVLGNYPIPYVRFVNEQCYTTPIGLLTTLLFSSSNSLLPTSRCLCDTFRGIALTDRLNEESLVREIRKINHGLTELMCHPGYDESTLQGVSRLKSRQAEVTALSSQRVKDLVQENNIFLTTYRDAHLRRSPFSEQEK